MNMHFISVNTVYQKNVPPLHLL